VSDLDPESYIAQHFLRRNLKYEMGVSFDSNPVSIWYNIYTFSIPYALNYYHRAILQSQSNCNDCDIGYVYDPYRFLRKDQTTTPYPDEESGFEQFLEILIYILFYFVLIYWPSIHIVMRIKEQTTKAKLLQFISGVNRFTYTMTNFLIDFGLFYIVVCIVLGMVAATGRSGFNTADDIILYLCLFACYGVNILAWIYLITPFFKNPFSGESAASNISFGSKNKLILFPVNLNYF
jgi:ATP-binding cassette subfamily A (ABC1) protein 3